MAASRACRPRPVSAVRHHVHGMMRCVEVRQLRSFVEIAHEGHVTRAAHRLLVAQPALSQQLRRLEKDVGAELFTRTARGVRLTQAGELLLPRAIRVLTELEDAQAELAALRGLTRGRLVLGATQWPGPVDLPALLASFHRAHPEVELFVRETNEPLPALLLTDEIDLAVAALPPDVDARVESTVLADEELVVVLAPGHHLLERSELQLRDLDDERMITFRSGSALAVLVEAAFARAGARPVSAVQSSDPRTIVELVGAGLGFAVLPLSATRGAQAPVAVRHIAPDPPRRTIGLLQRAGRHLPPAADAFRSLARGH